LHLSVSSRNASVFALMAEARHPLHCPHHLPSRNAGRAGCVSRGCNVRFILRPVDLFAPLRWPLLLSRGSGTFTSELSRIRSPSYESDIATWMNRQFPGRDLHPLETQHYRLHAITTSLILSDSECDYKCKLQLFEVLSRMRLISRSVA